MQSTMTAATFTLIIVLTTTPALAQFIPYTAGGGNPQKPTITQQMCSVTVSSGITVGVPCAPGIAPSDPNNSAFHGARVLIPSGVAGQAGMIANLPYPSTAGETLANATNAGYSFGWQCGTAGTGSITTTDGSVIPYLFTAGTGMQRDSYVIIDAEPGIGSNAASNCTFAVLR